MKDKKYNPTAKKSFKAKWKIYLFTKFSNDNESEISLNDFQKFILTDENVKIYTNEYWQIDKFFVSRSNDEIYSLMKGYESKNKDLISDYEKDYKNNRFQKIMPSDDFNDLLTATKCYYCGISKEEILFLGKEEKLRKKNLRGWNLEVERLKPNFEYSFNNCRMCCYWCNNAKTDEFSEEEFKAIGEEIGRIFKNRLSEK